MAPDDPVLVSARPPITNSEVAPIGPVPDAPVLPRWLALAAIAALLTFVGVQGSTLFSEWLSLRGEMARARESAVIGYVNVTINPSYAARPANWFHEDGDSTLLWSGWKHGTGHLWFRIGRGEIEQSQITFPMGRDVLQAIDYPLVEIGGGAIWDRVRASDAVVGMKLGTVRTVYPLLLLDKVQVVNELVEGCPYLITYDPMAPRDRSVGVYNPILDGRRLTMGISGYLLDKKPLLYDRGTESLWVADSDSLRAIAGHHKGTTLPLMLRPSVTTWSAWSSEYPRSRLLVGADRSRPAPSL